MASLLKKALTSHFTLGFRRSIHISGTRLGDDSRTKRMGHKPKSDRVEGEEMAITTSRQPFEYIDENLMEKVIGNAKFKDIPIVHIVCTRNNTKIALERGNHENLILKSAGTEGFKNCRKGTTVAAQAVATRVVNFAKEVNIDQIRLIFKGLGPGRDAAYKVFEISGLKVVSLSDRTEAIEPWTKRPRKAKRI